MNSLRRTVPLETIPLSSVIRLLLADLFRHQNWVPSGLEEQAAQHDVVHNGKRGTSGNTFKLCPGGNEDMHLVDAIAAEKRWQVVTGKIRRFNQRSVARGLHI